MWPFSRESQDAGKRLRDDQPAIAVSEDAQSPTTTETFELGQHIGIAGQRLGIPAQARVPAIMAASMFCGFALGSAKGGPTAADRYRAENAHRFPTTRSGWYLYHRTKSYHYIVGTVKEGVKFGSILMAWAALFGVTEEIIDRSRERIFSGKDIEDDEHGEFHTQRDAASTVMAALTTSGLYSWTQGFDQFAASRMARVSLKYSLAYGLAQDMLATLQSREPAYIQWIMRKTFRTAAGHDAT